MKAFPILVLALSLAFSAMGFADWPNVPHAWTVASDNGRCLFKMVPAKADERKAFGIAYSVTEDGELKELWRAEGWYGYRGHLSDDGRYLVLLGPPMQEGTIANDLAIAFYDQGKPLKEYKVGELLKDEKALVHTTSHYIWQPRKQTDPTGFFPGMNSHFHLVMADKTSYAFDVISGDIALTGIDSEARSSTELRREEQAEEEEKRRDSVRKGQEMLEKSSFRRKFEEHFVISGAEVLEGWQKGYSAEDLVFYATFTPKGKLAHPAMVEVVFPVKGDQVEVTLQPLEMIAALEKLFQHPFVENHFKNDGAATRLRMRNQGDRLHSDTKQLRAFLTQIKGNEPDDAMLEPWVDAVIDMKEPHLRALYLNIKTGEIIYKEGYEHPPVLVLLDAKGERVAK